MIFDLFSEYFAWLWNLIYKRTTFLMLPGPQHIWKPDTDPDPIDATEKQQTEDAEKAQDWDAYLLPTVQKKNKYAQSPSVIAIAPINTAEKHQLSVLSSGELGELKPNIWKEMLFLSISWLIIIAVVTFLVRFVMRKLKKKPKVQPRNQEKEPDAASERFTPDLGLNGKDQLPTAEVMQDIHIANPSEVATEANGMQEVEPPYNTEEKADTEHKPDVNFAMPNPEVSTKANGMQEAETPYNAEEKPEFLGPNVNVDASINQPDENFTMPIPEVATEVNGMQEAELKSNDSKEDAADAKEEENLTDSHILKETFYLSCGAEISLGCVMLSDDEIGNITTDEEL